MPLSYTTISQKPQIFLRLTGTTVPEFQQIVSRVKPIWESCIEKSKKRHGRSSHLKTFEDKLLALLLYYRTYITHEFIGYLVNLHNANVCRLFKKLEPLVARKITIKKDRSLTQEEMIKILADVTEQPIQRPQKKSKQRKSYSGKKKRHTLKVELVMQDTGKILAVSRTAPGRRHDFRIRKEGKPLPGHSEKFVDLGYQGLQKLVNGVTLPFRRSKHQPLTLDQKQHNRELSAFRMKVENKIREIKVFRIMSETYRNFQKKHNLRFNIIAGIVNLKHAF